MYITKGQRSISDVTDCIVSKTTDSKESCLDKHFLRELSCYNLLKDIPEPCIAEFNGYRVDKQTLYLKCYQGDLRTLARELYKKQQTSCYYVHIMFQMAMAVAQVNSANLVHNDVKLENYFYKYHPTEDYYSVVLGDFGLATWYHPNRIAQGGTINHVSPERLLLDATEVQQRHIERDKLDVWGLGMSFLILLRGSYSLKRGYKVSYGISDLNFIGNRFGGLTETSDLRNTKRAKSFKYINLPMIDETDSELWRKMLSSEYCCNEKLIELLSGMLKVDPTERFSIGEVLQHPLFVTYYSGLPLFELNDNCIIYTEREQQLNVALEEYSHLVNQKFTSIRLMLLAHEIFKRFLMARQSLSCRELVYVKEIAHICLVLAEKVVGRRRYTMNDILNNSTDSDFNLDLLLHYEQEIVYTLDGLLMYPTEVDYLWLIDNGFYSEYVLRAFVLVRNYPHLLVYRTIDRVYTVLACLYDYRLPDVNYIPEIAERLELLKTDR